MKRSTLDVDGVSRTYYIHLPVGYEDADSLPLVLAFHGGGGKATMMHRVSKLTATSDAHSFVVVYPDGLEKHWSDQRTMTGFDRKGDLTFISALLDELEREYKIDPTRIYSTGISNGGFFSQDLAIALPERIAAIASVAASVSVPVFNKVAPPQPVPILFMLGETDPIVPYKGGDVKLGSERRGAVVSTAESIQFWTKANQCTSQSEPVEQEKLVADDDTIVTVQTFSGATQRNEVVLYSIRNGGHTWPAGWQYLGESFIGKTSRQINASEEIWNFFERHHL
ncbi:PHB depolymerase family esterase [soil metagenome]